MSVMLQIHVLPAQEMESLPMEDFNVLYVKLSVLDVNLKINVLSAILPLKGQISKEMLVLTAQQDVDSVVPLEFAESVIIICLWVLVV